MRAHQMAARVFFRVFNNASNEYHRDLVFDAPARMVGRFENFLRDAARDHAPCCGRGQRIVVPAITSIYNTKKVFSSEKR